jgi:prepilin-type N-terminal cleavage/methylation domain-containing protein
MCGAPPKRRVAKRGRPSGARGFTLLELIIVLVILAMLIAMVWPALRRPLMRSVVQKAASQLVKDVARARMAAIDSGRIMALRYELSGRRYVLTFADALSERAGSPSDSAAEDAANDTGAADTPIQFGFEAELDEDVVFRDPSASEDEQLPPGSTLREMLEDERQERERVTPLIDTKDSGTDEALSAPVFFYPTGRAENAQWLLQGPDRYRLTVTLRGLTGAASIGPLERAPGSTAEPDKSGREPRRATPREEFIEPDAADTNRTRAGAK